MTKKLFWEDAYRREFSATVTKIEGTAVFLDQTCLNPRGGGLVSDTGTLNGLPVMEVVKAGEELAHVVAEAPPFHVGETVRGQLGWERRYRIMRMHTAAHLLSNVVNRETGALITGNQIDVDMSRVDFSLEDFDKERMQVYIAKVNELIARDLPVRTYFLKREEALQIPGMIKLAQAMPPVVLELRIVEIGDVDRQADGSPHVARTGEIGRVEFVLAENKGKTNRRVYYTVL